MKHVPATQHKGPDGLSRRPRAEEDTEESEVEDFLDGTVGKVEGLPTFINSLSTSFLNYGTNPVLDSSTLAIILSEIHHTPAVPFASFSTRTKASDVSMFGTSGVEEW
ncbi:hypothetical protein H0H93_000299, partial [Arthromyces matolae]